MYDLPFSPEPHSTIHDTVGDVAKSVSFTKSTYSAQLWIANKGSTDLLIEFYDAPLDVNSFRIAAYKSQPITLPNNVASLYVKRPAGSATEAFSVTLGRGY